MILTPGAWNESGYILQDLLQLIQLKHVIINLKKYDENKLFSPDKNIYNDSILISFEEALNHFNE